MIKKLAWRFIVE